MGITVLPTNNKNFDIFSFSEEKLKLVVHKNHALSKKTKIDIKDLQEQEFILFNSDFYLYYIDLNIINTVININNKNFDIYSFSEEKLKLVVHKNHALSKKTKIDIEDLQEQEFILFNSDFYLNDKIKNTCRNYGFNP